MDTAIKMLMKQTKCTYEKAKDILIKNKGNIDNALYCLLTNTEVYKEEAFDTSHLTHSQKKIRELREIVDVKDAYFCKIMEGMRNKTK